MSVIFSHLDLDDNERVFSATAGQEVIWEAAAEYLNRVNADIAQATSVFIGEETSDYKRRFKLPGAGQLQRRNNAGRYSAVAANGSWDVAFPLEDFGAMIASDDVSMAYMSVRELENHINTVIIQNTNTMRFEVLKGLLNNTQRTFVDPLWGSLSVEPLANGDSVLYPPVIGSESEATDNHYLESGYAAAGISDSNDPYLTIVDELEEHFGTMTGGSNIAVFINNAQTALTRDLASFTSVTDMGISPGNDTATVNGIPAGLASGSWRVLGRHDEMGCWIVEWRHIPANYMIGVHLDVAAPLVKRVDPADTGLGVGLQLVSQDTQFPFQSSIWRHRFGIGGGNRLNGVVMELGTGGTYSIPSGYS